MESAGTVAIKFKSSNTSDQRKHKLSTICSDHKVKVVKIISNNKYFLVICLSTSEADKLFDDGLFLLFTSDGFEPTMPNELKSKRTILFRRLDASIYSSSVEEIIDSIVCKNNGISIRYLSKFKSSPGMKVTFYNTDMASRIMRDGVFVLDLFIPPFDMKEDEYVNIKTCLKCYVHEHHTTRQCPKDPNFVICSLCSSTEHGWRDCKSEMKRCINCRGDHSTLAPFCPVKVKLIRERKDVSSKKRSYASPASPHNHPHPNAVNKISNVSFSPPVDADLAASTLSCILLTLVQGHKKSDDFENALNKLFKNNSLPQINLCDYKPPTLDVAMKSLANYKIASPPQESIGVSASMERGDDTQDETNMSEPRAVPGSSGQNTDEAPSQPACDENLNGLKIYRNYHPLRTGEELMEALKRGNAVVTDVNGNTPNYDIIADLCLHFDKFREVRGNIVPMKMDDYKLFKSGLSCTNVSSNDD